MVRITDKEHKAIERIYAYMVEAEAKHWEESGEPKTTHIYCDVLAIKRLATCKLSKRVHSLDELKALASKAGGVAVRVVLNFGVYSSKHIWYSYTKDAWRIYSAVDDSATSKLSNTNIQEAITKGALIHG